MRNNKQFGISGKGYYIALILCAAAIGISGYLYHQNNTRAEEVSLLETQEQVVPAGTEAPADQAVIATAPTEKATAPSGSGSASAPTAPTEQTPTKAPAARTLQTAPPVSGEEVFGYSMDCLSYNETTRDWRVHNGVDIAAPEGTQVCAAADGTVYTTYEDDSMGCTVVIRHEGGYTTRYSSLAQELSVKPGDQVTMGQVIGCVGSTALVETTMGSHIHFAVTYQDMPMDPAEFLSLS